MDPTTAPAKAPLDTPPFDELVPGLASQIVFGQVKQSLRIELD